MQCSLISVKCTSARNRFAQPDLVFAYIEYGSQFLVFRANLRRDPGVVAGVFSESGIKARVSGNKNLVP